jgi:hypothetical protein
MAAHGNNIEPQPRRGRPNLSHPDRVAMMRQREEIRRLPETDCAAIAPDCERMHRSAVSEAREHTTHALARRAVRDPQSSRGCPTTSRCRRSRPPVS